MWFIYFQRTYQIKENNSEFYWMNEKGLVYEALKAVYLGLRLQHGPFWSFGCCLLPFGGCIFASISLRACMIACSTVALLILIQHRSSAARFPIRQSLSRSSLWLRFRVLPASMASRSINCSADEYRARFNAHCFSSYRRRLIAEGL